MSAYKAKNDSDNLTYFPSPMKVDGGGGPPHNEDMENRLTKLETQFETVIPTLSTKSDMADMRAEMHKGFSDMVKWIVGTAIVMAGAGITIMTFVLNNATPKTPAPPASQPVPIVITIPAPQQAPQK